MSLTELGKTYEIDVKDNAIDAKQLAKIKSPSGDVTRSFDPGYMNTVNCVCHHSD